MQNRRKNLCVFFKRFYLFIFRQKGREGGKHQHVVASRAPHTGDLASNPGMCPDWELNQQPFGSQASAQSTEPHQPGQNLCVLMLINVTLALETSVFERVRMEFQISVI